MAIGDELQVLLGLVPIRDRAGIARGTMADAATAAANGQRPPPLQIPPGMGQKSASAGDAADITLPDDVRTEYTSGSGRAMSPVKAPSLGKGPIPGTPTADSERVVAASPAAAPSPEVVRGSDIIAQAYLQQQRQARLQSIFQSIGGIVGSLRGESVGGGGAAGGGGPDLNALKTIIDMRNQENQQATALQLRAQGIDTIQRKFGFSPEDAALYYDSGAYTKLIDQDSIAKREEAKRAGTTREELLKPEVVDALSRRLGQPPEVIRAGIREGKITPKDLTDIEGTQSQTAERNLNSTIKARDYVDRGWAQTHPEEAAAYWSKLLGRPVNAGEIGINATTEEAWKNWTKEQSAAGQGEITAKAAAAEENRAKAAKTRQETALTAADIADYERAKENREAFAKLYDLSPSQVDKALADPDTYKGFKKTRSGEGTGEYANYQAERDEALKKDPNAKFPDFAAWSQSKQPNRVESAEDKAYAHSLSKQVDSLTKSEEEVDNVIKNMAGPRAMQESLWRSDLVVGSKLSGPMLAGRKIAAKALGYSDEAANNTEVFFSQRDAQALRLQQILKGSTSNADIEWLRGIAGSQEMNAESIRRLMRLQDKADRILIERHNKAVLDAQAGPGGTAYRGFRPRDYPSFSPLLIRELREHPDEVKAMKEADENDAEMKASVRERYGPGVFEQVRAHL